MPKSQRLRLRDLRNIYRVIGECRELGNDCQAWRLHAVRSLCELVEAQVGIVGELHDFRTEAPRMTAVLDHGWAGQRERRNYLDFLRQYGPANNPQHLPLARLPPRPLITRSRQQLVSDELWYRCEHFNEQRRPSRIDGSMLSLSTDCGGLAEDARVQEPPMFVLALNRALGEPLFEKRERLITRWFHFELAALIGGELTSGREPSPSALAPRQQQVLACLLEGDSEKQVALRLGLSRQTVHQYVKGIYGHFQVYSRGELLARWIRRPKPPNRPARG
ncbi:MAG: helix-turn-helix transcriptional regulator [Pirellulaceae bacterium]